MQTPAYSAVSRRLNNCDNFIQHTQHCNNAVSRCVFGSVVINKLTEALWGPIMSVGIPFPGGLSVCV